MSSQPGQSRREPESWRIPGLIVVALFLASVLPGGLPAVAGSPEVSRGPYLQQLSSSSVIVRWRTDVATSTQVAYGDAPGALIWTEEDSQLTTEHLVTIDGLAADTRYYYGVGDESTLLAGDDSQHFFVTAPHTGTAQPTRVWVLGDSGTGDANASAVRDAYAAFAGADTTHLMLMLGDNAYPIGTDAQYQTKLFDMYADTLRQTAVWPTLGNHDAASANSQSQTGPYYDIFSLPASAEVGGVSSGTEAYYSFDHGNLHFVVLDSQGTDRSLGSPMLTWLEQDLAATAQDWIVAYWHHPPYSKGSHDSDVEAQLIQMRENVVPILEDHGVDLVLSGHSHSYERSFLIDGHYAESALLSDDHLIDDGDGRPDGDGVYWKSQPGPDPHRGAVYAVAGCSGKLSPAPLDHPAMYVSVLTLGSLVLDFDGDRLDATFLDSTGQVRDYFSIVKGCPDSGSAFASFDGSSGITSYLVTPGMCDGGSPCSSEMDTSVSSSLRGSFWLPGAGDPNSDRGTDSGTFEPLQPGNSGWVKFDPDQPAYIDGNWSTDEGVDGCIGVETEVQCMNLVVADQFDARGYFAAATAAAESNGDFLFDQPGGAPIELAPIPEFWLGGSSSVNSYTKEIYVSVPGVSQGLYLGSTDCDAGLLTGYRVYQQNTDRSVGAPVDRMIDNGWFLAEGGELPSGDPIPFGTDATITVTCYTAIDAYLGATLVFDSGFELPLVSASPWYILCSNCTQDNDQDGACVAFLTGHPSEDCDDENGTVFPGADQLCGDGLNNDCSHPGWPGLAGTNEFDDDGDALTECDGDCDDTQSGTWSLPGEAVELRFFGDRQTLEWDPPVDVGTATPHYDLLRSTQSFDFDAAGACISWDESTPQASDPEVPASGAVYYYLARATSSCGTGPLGQSSAGANRSGPACP